MSDINVENYKKSVLKILETWEGDMAKLAKQLAPILDERAKLEALSQPSADDKKRLEELKKQCSALLKQMETVGSELRLNLLILEAPPKADEKELVKIPAWLKDIIKKKGIPLGKHVTVVPNVDIDVKKRKLKSFGITLKVEF